MSVVVRRLALFTALSTMFALFVVGGTASAVHAGRTLDVELDVDTDVAGNAFHVVTATIAPAASATEGILIRFEVESGPSDTDAITPTTPDLTCTVPPSGTQCTVQWVSTTIGTDVVRAWIDHDGLTSTIEEIDTTEGRRATAADPGTASPNPGAVAEPDSTDVVSMAWTADEPKVIELTPETSTNPSGTVHRVVATVTDGYGDLAEAAVVTFTETGVGRFASGSDDEDPVLAGIQVSTDENGEAEVFTETFPGEEGDQSIKGTLDPALTACEDAVNVPIGTVAGDCDDTVTKTWGPGTGDECTITGTEADDVLEGTEEVDIICGLAGNDTITGLGGNDTLKGGEGNDSAKGGAGDDTVGGGAGDDALRGGSGKDTVKGGGGNDNLKGGKGNDALRGGKGTDTCKGGPGNDSIKACEN